MRLALVLAASLAIACSADDGAGDPDSATTNDSSSNVDSGGGGADATANDGALSNDAWSKLDAAPTPSSGCGVAATPGTFQRSVMVQGKSRTFTVVIPAKYDPNVPHSVVMRFHGWGATGAAAASAVGLKVPEIVVGPDTDPPNGNTVSWNTTTDLLLVDAIMDTLTKELCIDKTRNFATGYSNGGFMADAVGCHRSATFRGIAIQESGSSGGFGCGQVGAFILHNTDDTTVPISYGTGLRDSWVKINACKSTTTPVAPSPCVSYDGCSAGHPVVWCNPPTGGHKPNYTVSLGIGPFFDSL